MLTREVEEVVHQEKGMRGSQNGVERWEGWGSQWGRSERSDMLVRGRGAMGSGRGGVAGVDRGGAGRLDTISGCNFPVFGVLHLLVSTCDLLLEDLIPIDTSWVLLEG